MTYEDFKDKVAKDLGFSSYEESIRKDEHYKIDYLAIEEYAKSQYNQAIDDAKVIIDFALQHGFPISGQDIEDLKNKL